MLGADEGDPRQECYHREMAGTPSHALLESSLAGDELARGRLIELIYEDLRRVARARLAHERPDHTLQPTALVHEALLRLVGQDRADLQGRTHFLALAATSVRRVLIDHARATGAAKRGAVVRKEAVTESLVASGLDSTHVLDLHAALERLARTEARQAKVVELRFFGGLTLEEAAATLGVSRQTAKLDWRAARAWLARELGAEANGS